MNRKLFIKAALLVFSSTAIGAQAQTIVKNSASVAPSETTANVESTSEESFNSFLNRRKLDDISNDGATTQRQTNYVRPTKEQRVKRYLSDAFGVPALIGATFGATVSQIGNNPPEWRRTAGGFGKRFASSYGTNAIRNSISFGIAETFKLENRYEKSGSKDFGKRLRHAFVGSYTTRTRNGKRLPDFPQFIGTYSAAVIANEAWLPDRFSYKDGLRDGTISLGIRFGVNLLREFIFPK